jgi:endonuclease III
MRALARAIDNLDLPAVEKIAEDSQEDPFEVLIATMLSAQTRDAVTAAGPAAFWSSASADACPRRWLSCWNCRAWGERPPISC